MCRNKRLKKRMSMPIRSHHGTVCFHCFKYIFITYTFLYNKTFFFSLKSCFIRNVVLSEGIALLCVGKKKQFINSSWSNINLKKKLNLLLMFVFWTFRATWPWKESLSTIFYFLFGASLKILIAMQVCISDKSKVNYTSAKKNRLCSEQILHDFNGWYSG